MIGFRTYGGGPFPGMGEATPDTMDANPVEVPGPGVQSVPAIEQAAGADTLRDADVESHAARHHVSIEGDRMVDGTPPHLRPAGVEDRPARFPGVTFTTRELPRMNDQRGFHGEISHEISPSHQGNQQPGHSIKRTTYRLAPEPWDTGMALGPQEHRG